jgi:hypothetical protein
MTVAEFKKKWSRYQGKESAAYQEHFIDLCRLLGQPTPVEANPSGNDFFCFQKREEGQTGDWNCVLAGGQRPSELCL